jgi:hypothetical protein
MYEIRPSEGTVTRVSDGKVVAPCQSELDQDFVAYIEWVNAGNQPAIIESNYQYQIDA